MTWSWNEKREIKPFQVVPSALSMNLSSRLLAHPESYLTACPQSTVRGGFLKDVLELFLLIFREQRYCSSIVLSLVRHCQRPFLIVATSQNPRSSWHNNPSLRR